MVDSPQHDRLHSTNILVVEDEFYLADDLKRVLEARGAHVVGPVATLEQALSLAGENSVDCAVLDINLRGDMVYELADRLTDAGTPFLFATGYSPIHIPERFADIAVIEKPFDGREVATRLLEVIGR